jgi:hypothetical protein
MRIEPPIDLYYRRPNPILAFFSYAGAFILFAFLAFSVAALIPVRQPAYELTSAEGTEIYSVREEIWQPARAGDTLRAGDRLRTYKIGWAEISAKGLAVKLIGGSEMEISRRYLWNRGPVLHLSEGYAYVLTERPGVALSIGHRLGRVSSTFLPFVTASLPEGKFAAAWDPLRGRARIYAVENTLKVRSAFPWKRVTLEAGNTVEVLPQPFLMEVTPFENNEAQRLKDGFKKIRPLPAAPETAPSPAVPEKIQKPAPEVPQPAAAAPKNTGKSQGQWNLDTPSLFKTKSSAAEWTQGQFRYDVPNPESIAGVIFSSNGDLDASQFKTLQIQIRKTAGSASPDFLRIELKSADRTLRAFSAALGAGNSDTLQFPLRFSTATQVTEISLLVTHAKAGTAKKGGFQVTGISLS